MNDITVISPRPVQVPDPVTDGSMDELQDTLVPVQEEDLPQGVQDLLAALILRHRSTTQSGRAIPTFQGASEGVHDKVPSAVPVALTNPQTNRPIQHLPPQLMLPVVASVDRVGTPVQGAIAQAELKPLPSSLPAGPSIERASSIPESYTERVAHTPTPTPTPTSTSTSTPVAAEPSLPQALQLPPATVYHTISGLQPSVPAAPLLRPQPAPDVVLETLPNADRGLLQVPFSKGAANGQVTISRVPDEPTRSLQLSPSNALVFEQLKVPFEQIREPVWRLTDSGGEQQRQGSQQSPDEEQPEQSELPA
ncbi:invasion protein [Pseudomonas azerbaijanoccidens]|uniref:SpaN/EivJ family type III secretion system needle length determinant n=1 Tax=Pseudomonas azerbaijanoccidentalis TaxID=2842347 RepID=UPI00200AD773|nr:invasion protein [Pseudomonas azerbaijanoccidentalis]MCK8665948.1 invasion protein [Pseudomonas azerbaijanoccidentalis]